MADEPSDPLLPELWPASSLETLARLWITTPQALVAAADTPGGVRKIADETGLDPADVSQRVEATRARLSPEARAGLSRPADPPARGLGALKPDGET